MNWRGKPLVSLETIINLIAGTTNSTGLEVYARLDEGTYPDKIKVTNAEFETPSTSRAKSFIPSGTTSSHHTTSKHALQSCVIDLICWLVLEAQAL